MKIYYNKLRCIKFLIKININIRILPYICPIYAYICPIYALYMPIYALYMPIYALYMPLLPLINYSNLFTASLKAFFVPGSPSAQIPGGPPILELQAPTVRHVWGIYRHI